MEDILASKMAEAQELANSGATDSAESIYRSLIESFPESGEAYCPLAELLLRGGNSEAAEPLFLKAIELNVNKAWAHMGLGGIYRERGVLAAASDHYRAALATKPNLPWANAFLGDISAREERWDDAFEFYQRATELDDSAAYPVVGLGVCYEHWQRWLDAVSCYEKAAHLRPADGDISNALERARQHATGGLLAEADRAFAREELERAEALYVELAARDEGNPHPLCRLGTINVKRGRFEEAKAFYRSAAEIDPQYLWAVVGLGNAHAKLKQWGDAIRYYEQALKLSPDSDYLVVALEEAIRARGEQEERISMLLRDGNKAFSQNEFVDAEACYRELVEIAPTLVHPLCRLGRIALRRGDSEVGESYYARAVATDPGDIWAQVGLGEACIATKKWGLAQRALRQACEINPDAEYIQAKYYDAVAGPLVDAAVRLIQDGNLDQAQQTLGLAMLQAPDSRFVSDAMNLLLEADSSIGGPMGSDKEQRQRQELVLQRGYVAGLNHLLEMLQPRVDAVKHHV